MHSWNELNKFVVWETLAQLFLLCYCNVRAQHLKVYTHFRFLDPRQNAFYVFFLYPRYIQFPESKHPFASYIQDIYILCISVDPRYMYTFASF